MFNRNGDRVIITEGPDKGQLGSIVEVEDEICYIKKLEGNWKEMYDMKDVYGFLKSRFKCVQPITVAGDKFILLTKATDDSVTLPNTLKAGLAGTIIKADKGTSKVKLTDGTEAEVDNRLLSIIEGKIKEKKAKNLKVKANDIICFKHNGETHLGFVRDKYGSNYDVKTRNGNSYEIRKKDIIKKFTVSEICAHLKEHKEKDTLDKSAILNLLKTIKTLKGKKDDYNIIEAKRILKNELRDKLNVKTNTKRSLKLKDKSRQVSNGTMRNPSELKKLFWNLLKDVKNKPMPIANNKNILGVSFGKSGKTYIEEGTIKKIQDALNRPDLVQKPKSPFTKAKYVGIEIECFTKLDRDSLNAAFVEAGLAKNISLVNDNSIHEHGDKIPIEVRILATERSLPKVLENTIQVLTKAEAGVNRFCGLHVHLDMRNREVKQCFKNFLNCQDILFSAVDQTRLDNQYCRKIPETSFKEALNRGAHYDAISAEAYNRHQTLELRMHQGSVNYTEILNWTNTLIAIADSNSINKNDGIDIIMTKLDKLSDEDKKTFKQKITA